MSIPQLRSPTTLVQLGCIAEAWASQEGVDVGERLQLVKRDAKKLMREARP